MLPIAAGHPFNRGEAKVWRGLAQTPEKPDAATPYGAPNLAPFGAPSLPVLAGPPARADQGTACICVPEICCPPVASPTMEDVGVAPLRRRPPCSSLRSD